MSSDRIWAIGIAAFASLVLVYFLAGELKFQMDLGNLAVGVGTLAVAYVTNKSTRHQSKIDSAAVLANLRLKWSDDVRECASEFISSARQLYYINNPKKLLLDSNGKSDPQKFADEVGKCLLEINKHHSKLTLLVGMQKNLEIILLAEKISKLALEVKTDEFNKFIVEFYQLLEFLLEKSWNAARTPLNQ